MFLKGRIKMQKIEKKVHQVKIKKENEKKKKYNFAGIGMIVSLQRTRVSCR